MVLSRRFLLAGGAGTLGAAAGLGATTAAAQPVATGDIDLGTQYNVKAGQIGAALTNAAEINRAINEHPVGTRFVLPVGDIFVERNLSTGGDYRFAAIRINGDRHRLVLCGHGPGVTRLVLTGDQSGGLSQIIQVADGPTEITLCDFSMEHGDEVTNIDQVGLQHHQIELNAVHVDVSDVAIRNVHFGTCIGDAIRLAGGEGATTSTLLRNTTIEHVIMRLGKHDEAPLGCRSGISFQKGIRDLLLTDFYIEGPKNSCLDMEPTSHAGMDNITIENGTLDNSKGTTWVAASFDGFEDNGNVTSFLMNSRMVNVRIRGGQLQVVSTKGCTLDNIVIEANTDLLDGLNKPLLVLFRENEDLAVRNVDIVRGPSCRPGPLVTMQHVVNSPRRINIEGGTWTARVGPGAAETYVDMQDTTGLMMRGTRIRAEDTIAGERSAIKFRPGQRDMANIHLDGVVIETPDGLTNGLAFGAINRNISNLKITGCTLTGAADNAVAFSAANGFANDRFPILQGNDFARCGKQLSIDHADVFPVIAGNRGGQCTILGLVAPENVVAAVQGSQYIRQNGNAPELWWKATGTAATGWKKLA